MERDGTQARSAIVVGAGIGGLAAARALELAGLRVHVLERAPAIEALGSCTIIATDKTGTLTLNELSVLEVFLPDGTQVAFEAGPDLDALRVHSSDLDEASARARARSRTRSRTRCTSG